MFHQHSAAMARTTVRMGAMKSTAAENRVRPSLLALLLLFLFLHLQGEDFFFFSLFIVVLRLLQLRVCVSLVSPAVSPLPVHQYVGWATPPVTPETTVTAAVSRTPRNTKCINKFVFSL